MRGPFEVLGLGGLSLFLIERGNSNVSLEVVIEAVRSRRNGITSHLFQKVSNVRTKGVNY